MKIKLSPFRTEKTLEASKQGNTLTLNGEVFDFTRMADGDTLPRGAISSEWFAGDVDMIDGELVLTLFLPNPFNYSPEQAFPVDLVDVPDGPVSFPLPLPLPEPEQADVENTGEDADFTEAEPSEQQAIGQEKEE